LDRVAKFVHLCLNKKEGDKPTFLTKGTILTKPLISGTGESTVKTDGEKAVGESVVMFSTETVKKSRIKKGLATITTQTLLMF
jgi:hypothetical protein